MYNTNTILLYSTRTNGQKRHHKIDNDWNDVSISTCLFIVCTTIFAFVFIICQELYIVSTESTTEFQMVAICNIGLNNLVQICYVQENVNKQQICSEVRIYKLKQGIFLQMKATLLTNKICSVTEKKFLHYHQKNNSYRIAKINPTL